MTDIESRVDVCEQQSRVIRDNQGIQDELILDLRNEVQSLKSRVLADSTFARELAKVVDLMKTGLIDVQKENEEMEGSVMSMLTEMSRELAWLVTRIDQIKSKVDEQQAIFDTTMTDDNR